MGARHRKCKYRRNARQFVSQRIIEMAWRRTFGWRRTLCMCECLLIQTDNADITIMQILRVCLCCCLLTARAAPTYIYIAVVVVVAVVAVANRNAVPMKIYTARMRRMLKHARARATVTTIIKEAGWCVRALLLHLEIMRTPRRTLCMRLQNAHFENIHKHTRTQLPCLRVDAAAAGHKRIRACRLRRPRCHHHHTHTAHQTTRRARSRDHQ